MRLPLTSDGEIRSSASPTIEERRDEARGTNSQQLAAKATLIATTSAESVSSL